MRKALTFGVAIAVAVLIYLTVATSSDEDEPALVASEPTLGQVADVVGAGLVEAPAGLPQAVVVRLADGDSFDITWLDDDRFDEIRLIGINAPEGGACFGDDARTLLANLIQDRVIAVDGVQRDDFGRLLANVWVDQIFVNGYLVEQGAALALTSDGAYATQIASFQLSAEEAQRGLWSPSECGSLGERSIRIATIEFDAPGPDNQRPNDEWIEIENDGNAPIDLTGWSIRDESTRNRFRFPDGFRLDGGASVRVRSGCGADDDDELYWCAGDPVWTNAGDTGFLVDPSGSFVDTYAYDR